MNKILNILFIFSLCILSSCLPCRIERKHFTYISIVVPENYQLYRKEMTDYVQVGGENPLKNTKFVKKKKKILCKDDIMVKSAELAGKEIYPERKAKIVYFKIQNKTAYVLLNFDIDGWAGVSVATGILHPVVEKTLLQFPEIEKVIFDYYSKDKKRR